MQYYIMRENVWRYWGGVRKYTPNLDFNFWKETINEATIFNTLEECSAMAQVLKKTNVSVEICILDTPPDIIEDYDRAMRGI